MHRLGIRIIGTRLDHRPEVFIAALEQAREIGFTAVEILPDDFDLIVSGRLDTATLDRLQAILAEFPFALSVHAPLRLNLFDREYPDMHWNVLLRCAEICARLRAEVLVVHPGRRVDNIFFARHGRPADNPNQADERGMLDNEKARLAELARNFPRLTICMENHRPYIDYSPHSYAEHIPELVRVLRDINQPNVRMTLDTGHLNLAAAYYGANLMEWAEQALPWIGHLHIHDNNGIATHYTEKDKAGMLPFGRGDEHALPGMGTFPFSDFFPLLRDYQGIYLMELGERYLYPAKIRESLERVRSHLQPREAARPAPHS